MRGPPEEQPALSHSREEEACVSEEGQSFRGGEKNRMAMRRDFSLPERTPERGRDLLDLFIDYEFKPGM